MRRILGLISITVILAISLLACGKNEAASVAASTEQPGSNDPDSDFTEKYGVEIIGTAKSALERHINGFKMSLDPQAWTLAKYDDNDTVIAISDVTYHGSTGPYLYVGTLEFNDSGQVISATHHYIEADGAVLLDDGYCEDASKLIETLLEK